MPRSSRHKSHKQSKHSSRDVRERSDSEEDVKTKNGREEGSVRVSKDSSSGEKRKLASQLRDGKDLSGHGNGEASEEYVSSKRRKDRVDVAGSDRWDGGDERADGSVVDKGMKSSRMDSEKGSKSKVSIDSKSKSSRRHESERKEDNVGLVAEKEESKSGKVEAKRKGEKDSSQKEASQYKDAKEKEKERGSEKDRKVQDSKRDSETRVRDSEVKRKRESESVDVGVERPVKKGTENTEWPLQDELRNPELEKELEKRIRRRDGSSDKDKYQDLRESDDRRMSSRGEHAKDVRYKDERLKDGSYGDKYREDVDRENRHRDGKQREDADKDKRHRDEKYRDEYTSRDRTTDKSDTKRLRDENHAAEIRRRKSRTQSNNHDGSPIYDDRSTRYKDDKGKRRSDDKEDHSDTRPRSTKEQRTDVEKKSTSGAKIDSGTDRGRSHSRHGDVDSTFGHNRRRSSPSSSSHVAKEQYRHSKHEESRYQDSVPEERVRHSGAPEKVSVSRSMEKAIQKDDSRVLSTERRPNSDAQTSPLQMTEKSPSSTSIDRRRVNRADVRQSLDVEESGPSSVSKDAKDYSGVEGKASGQFPMETLLGDDLPQADGDNFSVSSPYAKSIHLPGNSKSLPPPPFRTGVDSSAVSGPLEEDRSKSNNRYKRAGDTNMGRMQVNSWKGVPNWPSPVANGFIPFQHGPHPVGFHPMMQQFPAPPMFGVRPSMELNHAGVPYHIADADRFPSHGRPFGWRNPVDDSCPPSLHGWDPSNGIYGDESHMYGRLDWDHNRNLASGRGWETSGDMWKGQNDGVSMELPSAPHKDDNSMRTPADEAWAGRSGQQQFGYEQNQPDLQVANIETIQLNTIKEKERSKAPETIPEKKPNNPETSKDNHHLWHVYLSKLDVSADLTYPELYNQCTSLMDKEQSKAVDEDASKVLYAEEVIEAKIKISNGKSSTSLFAAINDSVFQRAMSLYKKQREETRTILLPSVPNGDEIPSTNAEDTKYIPTSDQDIAVMPIPSPDEDKLVAQVSTCDQQQVEVIASSDQEKVEMSIPPQKLEVPLESPNEKVNEPVAAADSLEMLEEPVPSPDKVKMEVDPEIFDETLPTSAPITSKMEVDPEINQETSKGPVENQAATDTVDTIDEKLVDTKSDPLFFSDRPSEGCESVMPELIESGSVNLSRIHHSPESTH